jgi:flagellar basal-body rod protein FlgC
MSTLTSIGLSGLNAATLRLNASASNIANARSNGPLVDAGRAKSYNPAYTTVEVVQTSSALGGTQARLVSSPAAPVAAYDPAAPYADAQGMVATPDVDCVSETLQLLTARYEFAANLSVIRADDELSAGRLSIIA